MSVSVSHEDIRSLSRQPPRDPDIHATLSDFLTYTEHFPSHLTRALTLIHERRILAEEKIRSIHDDTTAYSILPTLRENRPDPVELRRRISRALDAAEAACRMTVKEAERLDAECEKETRKLDIVLTKLRAQPKPPSRDPTPEQQQLTSPNLKREARLGMRGDEHIRTERLSRRPHDKAASKLRGRKIMVPGEVLPPPDPNAPPESVSDWTSPRTSPPLLDDLPLLHSSPQRDRSEKKRTTTPRPRSRTPKPPKPRGPRVPGQPGTNAHSAVAGISTSNALLALTRPPEGAAIGSLWLPWMRLTEWEMAVLRKRMKKNAIWIPSQTMVRRELKALGRGTWGLDAAKLRFKQTGETYVNEGHEIDPTGPRSSDDPNAGVLLLNDGKVSNIEGDEEEDAELVNRGMRLNEAKKLKRLRMQEENALQEQIAREQGDDGVIAEPVTAIKKVSISPEIQKKRKRDETPTASTAAPAVDRNSTIADAQENKPALKKLKLTAAAVPATSITTPASTTTTKVPLLPAGPTSSPTTTSATKPARPSRKAATPPSDTATKMKPPTTLSLRAPRTNKAVSEEPPNLRRPTRRRESNASLPEDPAAAAAAVSSSLNAPAADATAPTSTGKRRSRRPAPGIVTTAAADEDGDDDGRSAKIGVSRRKAAPRRGGGRTSIGKKDAAIAPATTAAVAEAGAEEPVDPDEPRYCLCNDVSWGTMIACENEECEKEWFHLECVDLADLPTRRTKWYCPECTAKGAGGEVKMGLGSGTTTERKR